MKLFRIALLAVLAFTLAGCPTVPYEKPRTFKEEIAYTDAGIGAAVDTLVSITCDKYVPTGECATPGKPMHPAVSKGYLDNLERGHQAAVATSKMGAAGGTCLGAQSTPQACLQIATVILQQVQLILKQFAPAQGAK